VHQDVDVLVARLQPGHQVAYHLRPGRHAWVQVASGGVTLNGLSLKGGDGAAASEVTALEIVAVDALEVLLFDLA